MPAKHFRQNLRQTIPFISSPGRIMRTVHVASVGLANLCRKLLSLLSTTGCPLAFKPPAPSPRRPQMRT